LYKNNNKKHTGLVQKMARLLSLLNKKNLLVFLDKFN
jgi:hypothetical protein